MEKELDLDGFGKLVQDTSRMAKLYKKIDALRAQLAEKDRSLDTAHEQFKELAKVCEEKLIEKSRELGELKEVMETYGLEKYLKSHRLKKGLRT